MSHGRRHGEGMKKHPATGAVERARVLRRDMTDAERALWRMLSRRQIEGFKFRRQVPIGRFVADFVCHEARLVIEVDGGQHDRSSETEIARTEILKNEGYRVLRFWNNEILENPEGVHAAITDFLPGHHPE